MTKENAIVCVLTGRQMAAIASVAVKGAAARRILAAIFRMGSTEVRSGSDSIRYALSHPLASAPGFCAGAILHGSIVDGQRIIDEVVVGCEGANEFVIHCHGNPLLVEQIVKLCRDLGAEPVDVQQYMQEKYRTDSATMIEAEAKLAMQTCATLAGVKIVVNQLKTGLLPTVQGWLGAVEDLALGYLQGQCRQILENSQRAEYLLRPCKIVLVGPPNSGKSTLLNRLAGQDEVIVSDTAGTTRDWMQITCRIGPMLAEIYDTAGLDEALMAQHEVDAMAQQSTLELIRAADVILFVYDVTQPSQIERMQTSSGTIKTVIAANKCDLLPDVKREAIGRQPIQLCAKTGEGSDLLVRAILEALAIAGFNPQAPVCFTDRQREIVGRLSEVQEKPAVQTFLHTLVFGTHPE